MPIWGIILISILGVILYIIVATALYKLITNAKRYMISYDEQGNYVSYNHSSIFYKRGYNRWWIFDSQNITRELVSWAWPVGVPLWILVFILNKTIFEWVGASISFIDSAQDSLIERIIKPKEKKPIKQKEAGLSFLKN